MDRKRLIAYRLIDLFTDRRLLSAGIPKGALDHLGVRFIQSVNNSKILDIGLHLFTFIRREIPNNKIFIPQRSTSFTLVRFMDIATQHLSRVLGVAVDAELDHADSAIKPSISVRRGKKKPKVQEKFEDLPSLPSIDESVVDDEDQTSLPSLDDSTQEEAPFIEANPGGHQTSSRKRKASHASCGPVATKVSPPDDAETSGENSVPTTEPASTVCQTKKKPELLSTDDLLVMLHSMDLKSGTKVFSHLREHCKCNPCARTLGFMSISTMEAIVPYWLLGFDPTDKDECELTLSKLLGCVGNCEISQRVRSLKVASCRVREIMSHLKRGTPKPAWLDKFCTQYPHFMEHIRASGSIM